MTSQKAFSKSAYDLDTINNGVGGSASSSKNQRMSSSRHKSTSLQHLDETTTDDRSNGRGHVNGRYVSYDHF